jgi:hypothetical protein
MIEILKKIIDSLSKEELSKDIIYREKEDKIGNLFDNDISIIENGKTKEIYIAGAGMIDNYTKNIYLIYKNPVSKQIIIKPKEIMNFLQDK